MTKDGVRLAVYSLAHLWVDFCCALLMFSQLRQGGRWGMCLLLYNFCAFALQMPLGLVCDRLDRNSTAAALGCVLIASGWPLARWTTAAAAAAGVGNALFHVGGGIDVLNAGGQRAAPLGIFVSPGALGLFLGTVLGTGGGPHWAVPTAGLLALAAAMASLDRRGGGLCPSGNAPLELDLDGAGALACLFLVVVLRSYVGLALSFPWKGAGRWALISVLAVALGKTAGGFLGDRLGMERAAALSLGLSALLFLGGDWAPAGVAAVFLFNMTMPITLWAAAGLLPGGKGFAFGMLTFALFLGFVPVCLGWSVPWEGSAGYAAGALASLGLLWLGLKRGRA